MGVLKKYKFIWIAFIIIVLIISIVVTMVISKVADGGIAFDSSTTRFSTEVSGKNSWKMSYGNFNGSKSKKIKLKAGDTISIRVSAETNEGSLEIEFCNKNKEKIKGILEDSRHEFQYKVEEDGSYYIRVIGNDTKGSFDISWKKDN
ncbi:hypothetical protein [Clostridium cellulovorans]|uniref:Uncharacterized protein n=1 Tax=Clostridium cellulovorans (strain ATCC 35296 / DSM 3052 / OCM 3 / 743B) TaxID=573061 RepID=D9SQL8_CLOC7|nr:hypothetical protein [Clostridium cellulovorans]ADL52224.1 hypothetical protein Clocel_2512 [Clostridium cellulovorans 743B]